MPQIFDILIENGVLTSDVLEEAVARSEQENEKLELYLVKNSIVTTAQFIQAGAQLAGQDFVDLQTTDAEISAVRLLPERIAKEYSVIPFHKTPDGTVCVAITGKMIEDITATDALRRFIDADRVHFYVAVKDEINKAIKKNYRNDERIRQLSSDSISNTGDDQDDLSDFTEVQERSPTVQLVDLVIRQAITDKASDIHFEPDDDVLRIRYRLDGVLRDLPQTPPIGIAPAVSSRVKILCGLDIAETRKPQDGRLSVSGANGEKMDLRVSFLPLANGEEKIVMRILDNSNATLPLTKLGFSQHNLDMLQNAYKKPNGLILVTGPTGSGKSTTLYSVLNTIASPDINIITVEDPVEYAVPRINQVQVNPNPKVGMTFPNTLRAALRQDPDVILVGEMRDHETAATAMDASLTGHLVLSTLHTNDAASAVTRLSEMGVESYLVASVLEAVVAQRLVRKLCSYCKEAYMPDDETRESTGFSWGDEEPHEIYRPVGCRECLNTGYSGRMAVHEVLTNTEEVSRLIIEKSPSSTIDKQARAETMIPMREDGWDKVRQGLTHIDEVLRIVA